MTVSVSHPGGDVADAGAAEIEPLTPSRPGDELDRHDVSAEAAPEQPEALGLDGDEAGGRIESPCRVQRRQRPPRLPAEGDQPVVVERLVDLAEGVDRQDVRAHSRSEDVDGEGRATPADDHAATTGRREDGPVVPAAVASRSPLHGEDDGAERHARRVVGRRGADHDHLVGDATTAGVVANAGVRGAAHRALRAREHRAPAAPEHASVLVAVQHPVRAILLPR